VCGACLAGFGVAQVIDLGLEPYFESGALINVFPDWSDERFPLYVYYVSRNYVPAKVRRFIDFVMGSLNRSDDRKAPAVSWVGQSYMDARKDDSLPRKGRAIAHDFE